MNLNKYCFGASLDGIDYWRQRSWERSKNYWYILLFLFVSLKFAMQKLLKYQQHYCLCLSPNSLKHWSTATHSPVFSSLRKYKSQKQPFWHFPYLHRALMIWGLWQLSPQSILQPRYTSCCFEQAEEQILKKCKNIIKLIELLVYPGHSAYLTHLPSRFFANPSAHLQPAMHISAQGDSLWGSLHFLVQWDVQASNISFSPHARAEYWFI